MEPSFTYEGDIFFDLNHIMTPSSHSDSASLGVSTVFDMIKR